MKKTLLVAVGMVALGCQSTQQMLDASQQTALNTALTRARFDMNCPTATGTVLSRQVIEPVIFGGTQRNEYTIGIEGCGQRTSSVVICPQGGDGLLCRAKQAAVSVPCCVITCSV